MFVRVAAGLLALSVPVTVQAEGRRSEVLMDLLSRVPTDAIESKPGDWRQLMFADFTAAAGVLEPAPAGVDGEQLARFGSFARVFAPEELSHALVHGLDGAWEPLVGFGPHEIEAALSFDDSGSPDTALLLRLGSESLSQVGPVLLTNGYAERTQDGVTAWARGEVDLRANLRARNPADPFGGSLGRSSRVVVADDLLVQTSGWSLLTGVLGPEIPKGHTDLPALASALDSPEWGDARLLQAVLLPHQFDLATGRGGMPLWRVGMLADLGTATETVGLALFSYGSGAEAEAAAAHIAEAWDAPVAMTELEVLLSQMGEPPAEAMDLDAYKNPPSQPSFRERTGLEARTGVAGDGPYVAWVALHGAPEVDGSRIRNPGFLAFWMGVLDRRLTILGPV